MRENTSRLTWLITVFVILLILGDLIGVILPAIEASNHHLPYGTGHLAAVSVNAGSPPAMLNAAQVEMTLCSRTAASTTARRGAGPPNRASPERFRLRPRPARSSNRLIAWPARMLRVAAYFRATQFYLGGYESGIQVTGEPLLPPLKSILVNRSV
jgi:hypothetical protein